MCVRGACVGVRMHACVLPMFEHTCALCMYGCRFRMKCHLCVNYIEMQTDPASCDYVIVSGAQRKEERWDMAENEQILTTGENEQITTGEIE